MCEVLLLQWDGCCLSHGQEICPWGKGSCCISWASSLGGNIPGRRNTETTAASQQKAFIQLLSTIPNNLPPPFSLPPSRIFISPSGLIRYTTPHGAETLLSGLAGTANAPSAGGPTVELLGALQSIRPAPGQKGTSHRLDGQSPRDCLGCCWIGLSSEGVAVEWGLVVQRLGSVAWARVLVYFSIYPTGV